MSETTDKFEEQEVAEAEVQRGLGPFVVAAETTRMSTHPEDAKKPRHRYRD
jgi:hypothetical protein